MSTRACPSAQGIETAPPKLKLLLTNIFNLSLAADLIKGGVTSQAIRTVTTQSELIDRYEDERLPTQPLKRAASAAIAAMVGSRRLTVPRISVQHDAPDGVLHALRSPGERQKFEVSALQPQLLDDSPAGRWWRSLLSRLLSLVPEGALAAEEMSQFRAGLATENLLRGNPAFVSIETRSGPADDITDFLLTRDGVDLESEPDRSIRAATRVLEESLKTQTGADVHVDMVSLWRLTSELVEIIDRAVNPAPHAELLHSSWGAVSNAVERISTSDTYDRAVVGHPDLDALLALISRIGRSPYPEERGDDDDGGMMGWGNWDVRVYAASSAMRLAQRFAGDRPGILDELETFVRDPVPTVRLQVAQSINGLWDVARDRMWSLADYVAKNETSTDVNGGVKVGQRGVAKPGHFAAWA